jgi:dynactin complex subunit
MKKTLDKSKKIQEAVKAYQNDEYLILRAAASIYQVHHSSISNHLKSQNKFVSDVYTSYQARR